MMPAMKGKEQAMAVVRDQNGQPLKVIVYSDYI
jgi:hypothetical protein